MLSAFLWNDGFWLLWKTTRHFRSEYRFSCQVTHWRRILAPWPDWARAGARSSFGLALASCMQEALCFDAIRLHSLAASAQAALASWTALIVFRYRRELWKDHRSPREDSATLRSRTQKPNRVYRRLGMVKPVQQHNPLPDAYRYPVHTRSMEGNRDRSHTSSRFDRQP